MSVDQNVDRAVDREKIEQAVRIILEAIGEEVDRPGLEQTPARVARMFSEVCAGIGRDPADEINAVFETPHEELVVVRDIRFYSLCEHHLIPFFGEAHVAYYPKNGRVAGLSKLARLVDIAAKRPHVQERLTAMVADSIADMLDPEGVFVMIEAEHLCMSMRGVKKPGTRTVTTAARGILKNDDQKRREITEILNR